MYKRWGDILDFSRKGEILEMGGGGMTTLTNYVEYTHIWEMIYIY